MRCCLKYNEFKIISGDQEVDAEVAFNLSRRRKRGNLMLENTGDFTGNNDSTGRQTVMVAVGASFLMASFWEQ